MNELYIKSIVRNFEPATSCIPHQSLPLELFRKLRNYNLNVIDEQVNVYSAGMNF